MYFCDKEEQKALILSSIFLCFQFELYLSSSNYYVVAYDIMIQSYKLFRIELSLFVNSRIV